MKKNRAYYQKLFQDYPDLVTQAQLRQMLNGISISLSYQDAEKEVDFVADGVRKTLECFLCDRE